MKLTVIGSGDAFGSGGRLQAAYLVETAGQTVLLDCGATILLGIERQGIDADRVGTIVISHLHGDHFGGLVWWLLRATFVTQRTAPLAILGPPGIEARFWAACEILYPGSRDFPRRFAISFVELTPERATAAGPLEIRVLEVDHPSGAPSYAVRLSDGTRTLAYTGDSGWTEAIVAAGRDADLYLMECYMFERALSNHMAWLTIREHLDRIGARRVLLTHMSTDMLARRGAVDDPRVMLAEDGLVVEV